MNAAPLIPKRNWNNRMWVFWLLRELGIPRRKAGRKKVR